MTFFAGAMFGVIAFGGVFQQDAEFEAGVRVRHEKSHKKRRRKANLCVRHVCRISKLIPKRNKKEMTSIKPLFFIIYHS
jgi:hypothetical protein